jgi:hypothetical protein
VDASAPFSRMNRSASTWGGWTAAYAVATTAASAARVHHHARIDRVIEKLPAHLSSPPPVRPGRPAHERTNQRVVYRLRGGHVRALLAEALFHPDHHISGTPVHD